MKIKIGFLILFTCILSSVVFSQGNTCKQDLLPRLGENRLYGYSDLFGNWKVIPFYTQAYPFSGNVAIVKKGIKYGVINCEGNVVLRPEYDEILGFVNGFSWFRKDSKWGLINELGQQLLVPVYDAVEDVSRFSDFSWVTTKGQWGLYSKWEKRFVFEPQFVMFKTLTDETTLVQNESQLFGIVDIKKGAFVVKPQFTFVSKIIANALLVAKNGKYGLLNDKGQELLAVQYDSIVRIHKYRLKVKKGNSWSIVDEKGHCLSTKVYNEIQEYSGGAFRVENDGLFGYVNYLGREVIPCSYQQASTFVNQRAVVGSMDSVWIIQPRNERVSNKYNTLTRLSNGKLVCNKGGLNGLIDEDGKELQPTVYQEVRIDESLILRLRKQVEWFYFDLRTNRLFGDAFSGCSPFLNGRAIVSLNTKQGVLNEEGTYVLDPIYDSLQLITDSYYLAKLDTYTQLMNEYGKALGLKYLQIIKSIAFPLVVTTKTGVGLMNEKGAEVAKPIYTDIKGLDESYFSVSKGKKAGVLNTLGKEVLPIQYQSVESFSERYFNVQLKNKWGYVDARNKVMIDFQFDSPAIFKEGKAVVVKNGVSFSIDKKGNRIK